MQLLSGRNRWFQAIVLTTSQAPTPKGELLSLFQIQELKTSQLRRCSRGKRRGSASPTAPELHFPLCCSASALTQALCLPKTPRGGSCSHLPAPGTSQGRGKGKAGEGWNSSEGKQSSQCLSATPKPLLRPKPGVSASQNNPGTGSSSWNSSPWEPLPWWAQPTTPHSLHVHKFLQNTQNLPSPRSCTSPATGNNQPVQPQPKIKTLLKAVTC